VGCAAVHWTVIARNSPLRFRDCKNASAICVSMFVSPQRVWRRDDICRLRLRRAHVTLSALLIPRKRSCDKISGSRLCCQESGQIPEKNNGEERSSEIFP